MVRSVCISATLVAVSLAAALLAGCGGGSPNAAVVARVAGTPITRAAVNHWMSTLAGGDYNELSGGHTVPDGLVSDPPNYARCVARLEAAAAAAPKKIVKLSGLELLEKCRQLYQALKEQATAYLVEAQALIGLSAELGVKASDAEVVQLYKHVQAEEFPTAAAQSRFFASHRLTLADELFIVKLDVLKRRDAQRLTTEGNKGLSTIDAAAQRWTAKTSCDPGYVVVHCREYVGETQKYTTTSPAVLMEQVAAVAIGRCTNYAACLKQ